MWLRRRRLRFIRSAPTSADPVGDAIAAAGPVTSRHPGEVLNLQDLRKLIGVDEVEPRDAADLEYGFTTQVAMSDEVHSYADIGWDGLELALADQPGIEAVEHPDREWLLVRTFLSLPDVHAAVIRALLDVNRRPRPIPRDWLSAVELSELAVGVAATMTEHGFTGRLHMSLEDEGPASADSEPTGLGGFYRVGDGVVLIVRIGRGYGEHSAECVSLRLNVFDAPDGDPHAVHWIGSLEFPGIGDHVNARDWYDVAGTVEAITTALLAEVLPWADSASSRAAIVDGWVRQQGRGSLGPLWSLADFAARWGMRDQARVLLQYGHRKFPQHRQRLIAVAEKHQL